MKVDASAAADSPSIRATLIADSISNIGATLVSAVVSFVAALFMARILGPGATGVTAATVTLVLTYTVNAHLGVLNALGHRYPTLMGIGSDEARAEAQEMLSVSLGFVVLAAIVSAAVVLGIALWHGRSGTVLFSLGLTFGAIITALNLVKTYYLFVVRATNRFAYLGRFTFWFAWVPLAWLAGAEVGGLPGQWIAMAATELLMGVALFRSVGRHIRWRFDLKASWRYVQYGFPIYVVGTLFIVLTTVDRVATVTLLGTTALGLYGAASMAGAVVGLIPGILQQIMWPRLAEALSAAGAEWRGVFPLIEKPTFLVAYLLPPVIGLIVLGIPPAMVLLLPRFAAAIPAARVAILAVFFLGLLGMYGVFLGTSLRLVPYGTAIVAAIGVSALGSIFAAQRGWGIEGMAWTKVTSHALLSYGLMLYTWRIFGLSAREMAAKLVLLNVPMLWVFALTFWLIPSVVPFEFGPIFDLARTLVLQLVLLTIGSAPLIWIAVHHGGIATDIAAMLRRATTATEAAS